MIKDDLLERALETIDKHQNKWSYISKYQKLSEGFIDKKLSNGVRKKVNSARQLRLTEVSKIIKKLRNRGWSVIRIAYNANVSEQTIRMWENGKSVPHSNNFHLLKALLGEEKCL